MMPNFNLSRTNNGDARAIRELQILLNQHGANLYPDGRFARSTDLALSTFQEENGLYSTGVADEATWNALWGKKKKAPAKKAPAKKATAKKPAQKKAPAKKAPAKKAKPKAKTS
jgi:peptidoglycan hydrolase-like protein with peptidoglycan-binding domain